MLSSTRSVIKKVCFHPDSDSRVFNLWKQQTDFQFGFVPLGDMVMPYNSGHIADVIEDPILQHHLVRKTGIPNFLGVRLHAKYQLNIDEWKVQYWDQQLLQLLEYGFPLDFNNNYPLESDKSNHSSTNMYPDDVWDSIDEEISS